jgi:hypothetical protein
MAIDCCNKPWQTSNVSEHTNRPKLYLIAAPIGDFFGDLSVNALQTLRRIRVVFVEDTGFDVEDLLVEKLRSRGILTEEHELFPIAGPEDSRRQLPFVDEMIRKGTSFAILADRGLPCFIDPGTEIINHIIEKHTGSIDLVPIGASSAMDAAIAMSGVNCTRFIFLGHYPQDHGLNLDFHLLGVPVVVYVRGDSLLSFIEKLRSRLGRKAGSFYLTVFSNIRQRLHSALRRFKLSEPIESFAGFTPADDSTPDGICQNNFTVILHH